MNRLSVVIIAKNEEETLPRCLDSVCWADEIVVVDNRSTDRTSQIARERGAIVCSIDWPGFGPAKQAGVERASGEWILSIDADEVVSDALADEIKRVTTDSRDFDGFSIPRRTNFLGRWIYHGGWYPDRVLRLFRKARGRFDDAVVHEKVLLEGAQGLLYGELLHYSFPSLEHYFIKFNRYTTLGAEEAQRLGRSASWFDIVIRPPVSFLGQYIVHLGFLDGIEGFLVAALSAMAVMVKYAKLRNLRRTVATGKDKKHDGQS
jgi:glycosyltransferase involved in cell wall biosynthesis